MKSRVAARSRSRCWGASLALIALGLLLACRPPQQPASGASADQYFPMIEGAQWVYQLRSGMGRLEIEVTARGQMSLPGAAGQAFVMDEKNRGPDLGFVETSPVAYVVREGYVARISGISYDDSGGLRLLGQDSPTWILPLDPKPGYRWSQQTRLFQTPEGGGAQLGWSGLVKARTRVAVPAGHLDDVAEIETLYRNATGRDLAPQVRYRDYYARGVGLVRSVTEDP